MIFLQEISMNRLQLFPTHLSMRWWILGVVVVAASGCASPQKEIVVPGEPVATAPTPALVPPPAPAQVAANDQSDVAGEATTFSTQLATYTSVSYADLPGWNSDNLVESWPALLTSCGKLSTRSPQWEGLCARAQTADHSSNEAVRTFFEREFVAYQLRDDTRKVDGVVTGYFEPDLKGSRQYRAPYIFPVYGTPDDMVILDARKVDKKTGLQAVVARVENRNVVIQRGLNTREMNAPGLYLLNLQELTLDTLDRKVRLRIDGKKLVPYYTREEIEQFGAPNAKVLAFVDNLLALYEMQIQGNGRIRLTDGSTLYLTYAEQNGHPFRPPAPPTGSRVAAVKTRGGLAELDTDEEDDDETTVRTRGFKLAVPVAGASVAVPGRKTAKPATGSGIKDPSYVFFREYPPNKTGPIGAMDVPLQAGRSIAVDPRSTPLGYPVFVSTRDPASGKPMRRLTIAQDTGGAIRGAVRADYFLGNGAAAAKQARRMKENGLLWLFLPRGQKVASGGALAKTRGGASRDLPQCLVETEDVCVDDE
jgi:membrane-bound lytic murein transglycosylase A